MLGGTERAHETRKEHGTVLLRIHPEPVRSLGRDVDGDAGKLEVVPLLSDVIPTCGAQKSVLSIDVDALPLGT